jgi:NAD(P)-dependent dehydrogenase (short-subunit alcohol dehydrogenase family)
MAAIPFPFDAKEFGGKRVLITGGTKGIGLATARRLLEAGATVAVSARVRSKDVPVEVACIEADLGTPNGVGIVVQHVMAAWQGVDILIHCVGVSTTRANATAIHEDDAEWVASLNLNLLAAVRLDRALIPGMIERGAGVVVHVSSISRRLPRTTSSLAYASAKGAMTTYSKGLSKAVTPRGVRVVMISPGLIETDGARERIKDIAAQLRIDTAAASKTMVEALGGIPIGRMGKAEEVAEFIAFLTSGRADFITGVDYVIDGGTLPTLS